MAALAAGHPAAMAALAGGMGHHGFGGPHQMLGGMPHHLHGPMVSSAGPGVIGADHLMGSPGTSPASSPAARSGIMTPVFASHKDSRDGKFNTTLKTYFFSQVGFPFKGN